MLSAGQSPRYDPDLQDLATYASRVLDMPVALVTTLGERQPFFANVGFPREWTSMEESFCAHAVLQDGVLEVPDATQDPRFADNPLVAGEPYLRFYAGVPVRTGEGTPTNVLCVLDTKPRELDDFQRETLELLARQVEARLALRRQSRERGAAGDRRDRALETAGVATYDWDIAHDRVRGNALLARFFGVEGSEDGVPFARYLAAIHVDERADTLAAIDRAVTTGGTYETEYRVFGEGGTERTVLARGDATLDASGTPIRISGVVVDVTARVAAEAAMRESEARYRGLFESVDDGFCTLELILDDAARVSDYRFLEVNDAFVDLTGISRAAALGRQVARETPLFNERAWFQRFNEVVRTGVSIRVEEDALELGKRYDTQVFRIGDAGSRVLGALFKDVTERHAAERERARTEAEIVERAELFRTVFEQAPDDAILVMDLDRTLTAWNPAAERITGWSAQEAIGQPADIIFTPEDRAHRAPRQEAINAARDGKTADERWHVKKDGSCFWGSGTMNALHDPDGGVRGFLKIFRDATERHEAVQALKFLSELTDAILRVRSEEEILQTCVRALGEHLRASRVTFSVANDAATQVTVVEEWTDGAPSIVGTHTVADFGPDVAADFYAGRVHVSRDAVREYAAGAGLGSV